MRLDVLLMLAAVATAPGAIETSRAAGGVHIILDYEGFIVDANDAGAWLLNTMSEEVNAAGVQEVHKKLVVLGTDELSTSPPGFTSAVLIDESRATRPPTHLPAHPQPARLPPHPPHPHSHPPTRSTTHAAPYTHP